MKEYMNPSLASMERAKLLLKTLTPQQKLAQLQCMMAIGAPEITLSHFENGVGEISVMSPFGTAEDVAKGNKAIVDYVMERSGGIPPVIHVEALSGVMSPDATIFPSAIGMSASFDPDLLESVADTIRQQMIAVGFRRALSPVMDVSRDPRWGRIGETYGEDPTLCARMSVAYVKGLQGNHRDGAAATGKHFLGYGDCTGGLNLATNPIPKRELREVYAKPFQAAITEGDLLSVMNSYGTIDGDMVVQSKEILTGLLRDEMGFQAAVVSDYKSLDKVINHHLASTPQEAAVRTLEAGLDVECPMPFGYTGALLKAVEQGELSQDVIDQAVLRVLYTKFELGLFENPYPRMDTLEQVYHGKAAWEKSLKMARESIVLLKNEGVLPLPKKEKKIAVIGPHADDIRLMFGCYTYPASTEMRVARSMSEMEGMDSYNSADIKRARAAASGDTFVQSEPYPNSQVLRQHEAATAKLNGLYLGKVPTLLDSLKMESGNEWIYAHGCDVAGDDRSCLGEAIAAAKNADLVILAVGGKYGWGKHCTIGEGIDSYNIGLPGIQAEMAKAVCETGVPCVIVHMDARPLSEPYLAEHAAAILECWFPGITGGTAIADVLFGDCNPSGHLPVTIARNVGQIPIHVGHMLGDSYDSYMGISRYCDGDKRPLYYFGHGLSYSSFAYDDLSVIPGKDAVIIACRVRNTSSMDGDEVVQLYVTDDLASMLRPARELAGFKRVHLKAGEAKTVAFTCRYSQFAYLNKQMQWISEAGSMTVHIGPSSCELPLEGKFEIPETKLIDGKKRAFYSTAEIKA